jgi:hypothetical protein
VETLLVRVVGFLASSRDLVAAAILGSVAALFLAEAIALRRGSRVRAVFGGLAAICFLALGVVYAVVVAPFLRWGLMAAAAAFAAAALFLLPTIIAEARGGRPARRGLTGLLARTCVLLALLLGAAITLMGAGFLALTEDRPVLLVDVTGETDTEVVRWAPPNLPGREEPLTRHHVVFREPGGDTVAEAWVYGDQVAVKGRVLRLSPLLNVAGVPNLFELLFAHNGYATAERHSTMPHAAVPLPPMGPLAVHPLWRGLQSRLLAAWERDAGDSPAWGIRSATLESTYFPLVEPDGTPVKRTFRLVLTGGGLTAS